MNRQQRREYNKKNGTNYSRKDFMILEAYSRIVNGHYSLEDVELTKEFVNVDDEQLVPEGTPVKLYYDAIKSRPKKDFAPRFLQWVEDNKDIVLHVTRENASRSLVCVKEDVGFLKEGYTDEDRDIGHVPWLFSIYDDFLYCLPNTDTWVTLGEYSSVINSQTIGEKT